MKSIMISIKPKWCAAIMNGEKTIEVRKNKALANAIQKLIDENGYADIYVYCSKNEVDICGRPTELVDYRGCAIYNQFQLVLKSSKATSDDEQPRFNGKVLFKFRCYKVEEIKNNLAMRFFTESAGEKELLEKSCLDGDQLFWYLAPQELKVKCCGYAIYISNLEIFDKPKELSEFKHITHFRRYGSFRVDIEEQIVPLTKAPQNFCYIEE